MAASDSKPISGFSSAATLTGAEYVVLVQGGVTHRGTVQQFADYAVHYFVLTTFDDLMRKWEDGLPVSAAGLGVGDWWSNSGMPTRVKSL